VLLSKKIVFSIVAIPCLWVFYAMLLMLFSPLEWKAIAVLFLCCPLFSYLGVMAVQAGMVDWKDLRPAFLRLLPSFREETQRLPALRHSLQKDVRAMVKKYGPELGPLYFEKSSTWEKAVQARKKIGQEIGLRVSDSKLDFVEDTAALSGEEDMEQPGSDGSISPVVHKKAV
jgi:hypothetical protein